jgi:hypothetical protein
VQERRQLRGGVLLHRRQEVCVDPQRHLDFGVTESALNTCAETLADSINVATVCRAFEMSCEGCNSSFTFAGTIT